MNFNETLLWGDEDEHPWNGANRRLSARMYIPPNCLSLDVIDAKGERSTMKVANLSRTGLGGGLEFGHSLREGSQLTLSQASGLRFKGSVVRVGVMDVGIATEDKGALLNLCNLMKSENVTVLHHRNEEVYVEGYLGYAAHAELRKSRSFSLIDLSRVNGMDSFGLGMLMYHNEKGTKVSGCSESIRKLLDGFRFCKRCHPHKPSKDCPAYHRVQTLQVGDVSHP